MAAEPMTLRERYASAMSSSRLELNPIRRGALDIIMAAGGAGMPDDRRKPESRHGMVTPEDQRLPLGTLLFRLLAEYDEARGPRAVARRNYEAGNTKESTRAEATTAVQRETRRRVRAGESQMTPDELRDCVVKAAEAQRDQLAHDARMAHAFVLMQLKSLAQVKEAFGTWAMLLADKRKFMFVAPLAKEVNDLPSIIAWREAKLEQRKTVQALAGQILDHVLDPNCYRCEGRGFNGGYTGSPQKICSARGCGGSGRRDTAKIGRTKEQGDFVSYLMLEVDIMLTRVTREMNDRLKDEAPNLVVA